MSTSAASTSPATPAAAPAPLAAPQPAAPAPTATSRPAAKTTHLLSRGARWPRLAAGVVVLLYLLLFARGLGWQWRGILTATDATVPVMARAPR